MTQIKKTEYLKATNKNIIQEFGKLAYISFKKCNCCAEPRKPWIILILLVMTNIFKGQIIIFVALGSKPACGFRWACTAAKVIPRQKIGGGGGGGGGVSESTNRWGCAILAFKVVPKNLIFA